MILSISGLACAERPELPTTVMSAQEEWGGAEAALAANTERLLRIPGVVGVVGLGRSDDGRPAVHVYVSASAARLGAAATIPQGIEDVPVKIIVTDAIEAR